MVQLCIWQKSMHLTYTLRPKFDLIVDNQTSNFGLASSRTLILFFRTLRLLVMTSVVTLPGICNSVGGGVFLTCHRGAGGKYQWVSRLGLIIGNRWMWRRDQIPAVLECANCSRHATVGVH